MSGVKIIAFAGSTREASLNKKLVRVAARMAGEAGAEVTLIDLRDYPMPIYDGDLESREGVPENGVKLKHLFAASHGLLIASPENNANVSAVLKNTFDWLSRPHGGPDGPAPFKGKVAALLSASPGIYGGVRGLLALRVMCQTLGVLAIAEQHAMPKASEAFDAEGGLKDAVNRDAVAGVVKRLVRVAAGLS